MNISSKEEYNVNRSCTPKGGVCKLYLTEKFWLLKYFNDKHLLNKELELISKCIHEYNPVNIYLLKVNI